MPERCPGCQHLVEYDATGSVRVEWNLLSDGRYIGRAIGAADTFEIVDGELDFSWTPEMKPRTAWVLHECSYRDSGHDRARTMPEPPTLTTFGEQSDLLA